MENTVYTIHKKIKRTEHRGMKSHCIVFQIKFLDCVIGRPPSTTYELYDLLRGALSGLAKNII